MADNDKCPDCGSDMFCFDGGGPSRERHKHDVGGKHCLRRQLAAEKQKVVQWEAVGNLIMEAITGQPCEFERMKAELARLRAFVVNAPCQCYDEWGHKLDAVCDRCKLLSPKEDEQ